ncbi:hypothetical protein NDU88_000245 [Pleurodeles waltl]|uniref:Uncharacterized protein n=1 Tax=Pleurodeles waltl TaxID=8319 RepID=A0AAV7Q0R6_PLEWA|nr:hypothetical protein NDU88_000245 [Pleurodeles waltl]
MSRKGGGGLAAAHQRRGEEEEAARRPPLPAFVFRGASSTLRVLRPVTRDPDHRHFTSSVYALGAPAILREGRSVCSLLPLSLRTPDYDSFAPGAALIFLRLSLLRGGLICARFSSG